MDLQKRYLGIARALAKKFVDDKNVVGITLTGGVSRGTGDIYSEVDINFFVKDLKKSFFPDDDDLNINGVWVEIKNFSIEESKKEKWSMYRRWDASYSKILFQRGSRITNLLKKKVRLGKNERKELMKEVLFESKWNSEMAHLFANGRKDVRHAHMMLNFSIEKLVDYLFLKANELIPHFKWKHYYFRKLDKIPSEIRKKVYDASKIRDFSKKEFDKRLKVVIEIFEGYLKEEFWKAHKQDLGKIKNFSKSLDNGIKYCKEF